LWRNYATRYTVLITALLVSGKWSWFARRSTNKGELMGFGFLIVLGLIIWSYVQPRRALPHAALAAYFGLNAGVLIYAGVFSIWVLVYGGFAIWSGSRALKLRRAGYRW